MSRRAIVAWVSLLGLTACNGGVALDDLPDELASAYCDTAASCLGALAERTGGAAACQDSFAAGFRDVQVATIQELVDAGRVTYAPAAAESCLSAVRALGCDVAIAAEPEACRTMFTGTVAEGEACSVSPECAGDAFCAGASCPDVVGTCTARKASGQSCAADDECQSALACEDGVCRTPASTSGGACGSSTGLECPVDELCVGQSDTTPGTCTPFTTVFHHALGETCDIQGTDLCTADLSCAVTGVSGTMPMASCVAPVASGASCNAAIPSMCPLDEYCTANPFMGTFEGTCEALPTEGQPCAQTLSGNECAPGLQCDLGMCEAPARDNGESCADDGDCVSSNCDGGTCAAPPLCM
jgi:hypothetical protein